jgi:hypothetical protein
MDLISAADYAHHAGLSRATVSQQIARGKIPVYGLNGERMAPGDPGKKLINAAEADRARSQSRNRVNVAADEAASAPRGADQGQPNLTRARTASEVNRATLAARPRGAPRRAYPGLEGRRRAGLRRREDRPGYRPAAHDADDLATAVARGGVPALRLAMKEIARRMRTAIADSLILGD